MRTTLFILSLLLTTSASAQLKSNLPDLNVEQVMAVAQGLSSLDCIKDTIKDGVNEKEICRPYKFGGGLVLIIAKNLSKAREVSRYYQDAHNRLLRSMADPSTGKVSESHMVEFIEEDKKILSTTAEVHLDPIRWTELAVGNNAGQNSIPPSVISLLQPILEY